MKIFKRIIPVALCAAVFTGIAFAGCKKNDKPSGGVNFNPTVTKKEISQEEYVNKTLGGLLGQFAGFLSGYEFVWYGPDPYIGMPESWFEFLNGPYAGNFKYFTPPDAYRYDRLRINEKTGKNEVWSDDDYHIDIFNQLIMDEFGTSSYAVKEAWKKYNVGDWGGGDEAMRLINSADMLAPFTGTIEAGNRYGWCTEAYIENETLGMNAPGMPNKATALVDTFASNVGYFNSVVWAKFYAAMYSIAYFENDIKAVMQKAAATLPAGSYPRIIYDKAFELYEEYPNDYKTAAQMLAEYRRMLYRLDNIQTDPDVNGGFAVLSWLYGKNSYLDTCKYSSIIGYDGDCTAAICVGVMGILKGFKPQNEEYKALNETIYYDGEGVYYNDEGLYANGADKTAYQARIKGENYPVRQRIDDIVALYKSNFEKILLENGGEIKDGKYVIPATELVEDRSLLFKNYDAEERDTSGYNSKNGKLECLVESQNGNSHSGYAAIKFTNTKEGEVYHKFENLVKGKTYRLSVYVKTSDGAQVSLFARDGKQQTQEITFANVSSVINKEFIFEATSSAMDVGFKFGASALNGESVIFDDFMLEEIQREFVQQISDQNLKLSSDGYLKTIKKPEGVKADEEVIISIKYRSYSGAAFPLAIYRNSAIFGSVMASNTSKNGASGYAFLEIPYVFEKDSDVMQLKFNGYKMYIGEINVYRKSQYMFR